MIFTEDGLCLRSGFSKLVLTQRMVLTLYMDSQKNCFHQRILYKLNLFSRSFDNKLYHLIFNCYYDMLYFVIVTNTNIVLFCQYIYLNCIEI